MSRKGTTKNIENSRYINFIKIAESFYNGAKVAFEFDHYNAAGVLIIHSAIAYADAITIKLSSLKSSGENHYEVIKLLKNVTPPANQKQTAINQLEKLIDHKNVVSYSGDIYDQKDVTKMFKHLDRFISWAKEILE